jgi:hypothetical protein
MGAEHSRVQLLGNPELHDRSFRSRSFFLHCGLVPGTRYSAVLRASSSFTVASTLACPSGPKGVDSARPTAPPRPDPLRFAAKTLCSFTRSGRLRPLHASRAWAHGPLRGSLGHSGKAAHAVPLCSRECGSCRALSNTGLKRTRIRGCSGRLSFMARHLSSYLPRAA